ncbi:MAG: hypothetical protein ACR2QO_22170 [Acidimicrobiales bacterium]
MTIRSAKQSASPSPAFDRAFEHVSRWAAARTTRRSFLHRMGQVAMFVAAGPAIAGILIREAQARVCGQSGVTPKCDTFDCTGPGDVWGWCWYASDGCCRNDGLKKICDCCTVNYPNVHGYCPSGTNVRCIVESCGNDPRVLAVALTPIGWEGDAGYHRTAIHAGHRQSSRAVVAQDSNRWMQYIAAPLAGTLGVPLLGVASGGPSQADLDLFARLGVSEIMAVGPVPGLSAFTSNGIDVDVVSAEDDLGLLSRTVAAKIASINDVNRTVTVETVGLSAEVAPAAAAFAALGGFPLIVGAASADIVGYPTLYVGPEPADVGLISDRTTARSVVEVSMELAELAAGLPNISPNRIAIAPSGGSDSVGLSNLGVPVVLHPLGRLGALEDWIQDHSLRYGELAEIYYVQGPGQLTTEEYWRLQGAANGFRVDQLTGVAGEGLPVIRQPLGERPIGMARTDGAFSWGSEDPPGYWTNLGQVLRR